MRGVGSVCVRAGRGLSALRVVVWEGHRRGMEVLGGRQAAGVVCGGAGVLLAAREYDGLRRAVGLGGIRDRRDVGRYGRGLTLMYKYTKENGP